MTMHWFMFEIMTYGWLDDVYSTNNEAVKQEVIIIKKMIFIKCLT